MQKDYKCDKCGSNRFLLFETVEQQSGYSVKILEDGTLWPTFYCPPLTIDNDLLKAVMCSECHEQDDILTDDIN